MSHTHAYSSPNPRIANEINAATKKLHVELNRLIIDRLGLALPPRAPDPARYAVGISRFAPIFLAFEKALDAVEKSGTEIGDEHDQAVKRWVASVVPPALRRSSRLKADIEHLRKRTNTDITIDMSGTAFAGVSKHKPHILIAYTWIMYMAIFSGGRWIRQQLASAGDDFWLGETLGAEKSLDIPGFSFLSFDEQDGEALKTAFKEKLSGADDLLTEVERLEIVDAGQDLFQKCIDLINKIDRDVWWLESTSSWSTAYVVLGLGLLWLLWRLCTGQSILTD